MFKLGKDFVRGFALAIVAILSVSLASSPCFADWMPSTTYSDTLEWSTDISATPGWNNSLTTLTYEVTYDGSKFSYWYKFTVPLGGDTNPSGNLSHFIIEVSPDFYSFTPQYPDPGQLETEEKLYTVPDPSNPGMPSSIYGLKFLDAGDTTYDYFEVNIYSDEDQKWWEISFDSMHMPVWGDFYAVDGKKDPATYAYNTGFGSPDLDPLIAWNLDGSLIYSSDHILLPDTVIPVPGAVILGLLGMGVVGLKLRKYA